MPMSPTRDELSIPLESPWLRLEPLAEKHRAGLRQAASDPKIWTHLFIDGSGAHFDPWFDWSLKIATEAKETVWVVVSPSNEVVGTSRYLNIDLPNRRVEIGHTWYAQSAWATKINPGAKYLLLRHGFDTLGLNRIELKTDIHNTRSQAAISKLGATREGVLRQHMVRADGSLRDTVMFSITRDEWPQVASKLLARLEKAG